MPQYHERQLWEALKKCWKAYKIAKVQNDKDKMVEYAKRIRYLQGELKLEVSKFPNIGLE